MAIDVKQAATGHAVVCVDAAAENQIVIHGGANRALTVTQIERSSSTTHTRSLDMVLLQR